MLSKLNTTSRVISMLEVGVPRENFLKKLFNISKKFTMDVLNCVDDRLKMIQLIKQKYFPLERELKKQQAKLYDDLVRNKPPEECQTSARAIEDVERRITETDITDKAPILKKLETHKDCQVSATQKLIKNKKTPVVRNQKTQLRQIKDELEEIYGKMSQIKAEEDDDEFDDFDELDEEKEKEIKNQKA